MLLNLLELNQNIHYYEIRLHWIFTYLWNFQCMYHKRVKKKFVYLSYVSIIQLTFHFRYQPGSVNLSRLITFWKNFINSSYQTFIFCLTSHVIKHLISFINWYNELTSCYWNGFSLNCRRRKRTLLYFSKIDNYFQ